MSDMRSNRGFVLPAAVFALILVGVLVTGGFYLARQETRIGVASERSAEAFYLAENGALETMSAWDMATFGALPQWGTATVGDTVDRGIWSVNVTRMSSRLYFLLSTGSSTAGEAAYGAAQRMLGVVARLRTANLDPRAALTTLDDLKIGGSAAIDGHDANPSAWAGFCDPEGAGKPGVMIDDLDNINYVGNKYDIDGVPPTAEDPTLTTEDLLTFGDMTWEELVSLASKVYPSGASTITQLAPDSLSVGGNWECNGSVQNNWGDPLDPSGACGTYFPIIYAQGDLKIAASDAGQGILLVEGDLEVSGGHQFYGPVIIKGYLKTTGTGGHFNGGVIAANVELDLNTVLGNALVQFSSCAIERAVLNNSDLTRVRPLPRRSWVDLSTVVSG